MDDPTKRHGFEVTGGFSIRNELTPEHNCTGGIRGFKLPDGRIATLVVALEVENDGGVSYDYITSEKEMNDLGFEGLDYANIEFENI